MATGFVSCSAGCSELLTPVPGDAAEELQSAIHPDWRSPAQISSVCPGIAAAASMITSGQASMTDG